MKNEKVVKQINWLCESMSFAPAISLVKCHKIKELAKTKKQIKDGFKLTDKQISEMNRIKTDSYFGSETGEEYLYLLQEAIFLGLVSDKRATGVAEAMEMYNRGITITI